MPAHDPPASTASDSLFSPGRCSASIGAVALISMLAFEAIAVATAMPAVAQALDGLSMYAIAFGATLATSIIGMVVAGELCDRRGPGRAAALGLGLFMLGLLCAGLADRMLLLVLGRGLQGLGSGILGVTIYVGVGALVPPALHPRMFALFAAAWVVPALVGPALASGLVAWWGWRWVFLAVAVAAPLAAALLLPALWAVQPPAPRGPAPLPWPRLGWAALAAAGALGLHAASQQPDPARLAALLIGGAALAGLAAARLLPGGTLRAAPGLPCVVALRGLIAAAFASAEAFIPLMLNRDLGWSLTQAGLALSAGGVMWSLGSAVQARLKRESTRRRGLTAGFALAALGLAVTSLPALGLGAAGWVMLGWSLCGLGIGLAFPMLSVLTLQLAPPGEQGQSSSALQLSDALTSSAALAVAGLLFNAMPGGAGPSGGSAALPVLLLALGLAGLAAVVSPRAFRARPGKL